MRKSFLMQSLLFLCFVLGASVAAFAQETYKAGDKVVIQDYSTKKWYDGVYVQGSNDNHEAQYTHLNKTYKLGGLPNDEIMPPAEANQKKIVRENAAGSGSTGSTGGTGSTGSGSTQVPQVIKTIGTGTVPTQPSPSSVNVPNLETAIVAEVNRMRANPKAYANELAQLTFISENANTVALFAGNDRMWTCAKSDVACINDYRSKLQEAINALYGLSTAPHPVTGPLSQLTRNTKLNKACEMLAADMGQIDGQKHKDSQQRGVFCRAKLSEYNFPVGECLNSSFTSARGFVLSFMLSTGHRKILTGASYNEIGVDVHYHTKDGGYLRDVIILGDNKSPLSNTNDPCANGW